MKHQILEHVRKVCGLKNEEIKFSHLYFAIDKIEDCLDKWHIREVLNSAGAKFHKSVEQNLEDPQVCEVISKLVKLK